MRYISSHTVIDFINLHRLTYTPIKWDNPTITQLEGGELNVFS